MAESVEWIEKTIEETIGPLRHRLERAYDEVIGDKEKELTRRDREHQRELKKRDERRHILSEHLDKHIIENAYLIEENARLKHQLKEPALSAAKNTKSGNLMGANVPADDYRHLTDKYNELNKRYQDTCQRVKYVERKNVTLVKQNKDMKENVRAWQKYCDRLETKYKSKREARLSAGPEKLLIAEEKDVARPPIPSSPEATKVQTPLSFLGSEVSSPTPLHPLIRAELSLKKEAPPVAGLPQDDSGLPATSSKVDSDGESMEEHLERIGADNFYEEGPEVSELPMAQHISGITEEQPESDRINSSQTTVDEIATQRLNNLASNIVNSEPDDVPMFISEKSLKRKRATATRFNVFADRTPSDGTPVNPFKVKEEQSSSPPALAATYQLLRKETLDLDELGLNVISTPHRRRRHMHYGYPNTTGTLHHQRSDNVPFFQEEVLEDDPQDIHVIPSHTVEGEDASTLETRASSEPCKPLRCPEILQQLDPNIQTAPKANQEAPSKRRKKYGARQAEKFRILSESGEEPPPINGNYSRLAPNVARAQINRRLQAAKDVRTPTKYEPKSPAIKRNLEQIPTPPSSSNRAIYTPSSSSGPSLGTRHGYHEVLSSAVPSKSGEASVSASRKAWQLVLQKEPASDIQPTSRKGAVIEPQKQTPLRSKLKAELRTSDFKANPAYNQGYSFAFAETVRKRADRACLPGCTRPECCGSTFRALASVAGPLSPSEEEKLLEEYLGDAYDGMFLTQMTFEERKELILQARTRQMAKLHGRHRQTYERHTTPPGFWRVDFPTTQEDAEDKRRVVEMERVLVEERWMEAMRKEGRWMFRDE